MSLGRAAMIDIYLPDHSRGLMVDALVLQSALGISQVRIWTVPASAYAHSAAVNDKTLHLQPDADTAVFVERLFEHSAIPSYARRVYLPNPEWMQAVDAERAVPCITEFWHKTHFSHQRLTALFPEKTHHFTGFTSPEFSAVKPDHTTFAHFAGKSKTRHTQDIVDLWRRHPDYPLLTLQTYGSGLSIPEWLEHRNMRIHMGYLDDASLKQAFIQHGIHLCLSQMEGFGHYINEARSLGALVITMDAPPMNELIDPHSGILIQASKTVEFNHGTRYIASKASIQEAIDGVLRLPLRARASFGEQARKRYLAERDDFLMRIRALAP